jgi:hypothetical protein
MTLGVITLKALDACSMTGSIHGEGWTTPGRFGLFGASLPKKYSNTGMSNTVKAAPPAYHQYV